MLGTDITTQGGIGSVVRSYRDSGLFNRLNIRYLSTHRDGLKFDKFLFFIRQIPIICFAIFKVDLVHLQTSQGWSFRRLVFFYLISSAIRKKVIWHVHGSTFDNYYIKSSGIEKKLIRYALTNRSSVIALSNSWKERLQVIAPKSDIRVIRNGIILDKYRSVRKETHRPFVVTFLGRLGVRKGTYDLIHAIELLKDLNINFKLAGDGDIQKCSREILSRGLNDKVEIRTWLDPDSVVSVLKSSDLYVLPSYDEGLPMGILEAMASGLPIVSTNVGGIPEAVESGVNGLLIEPGDVKSLALSIQRYYSDIKLWHSASQASLERAESQFSMESVELSLRQLYSDLGSNLSQVG
ncbi:hypothetical protein CKO25_09395 [Thiocapsa imhoffii]|uniref:Glycosyltransferase family 1 protein n=2 Tax=Thiocapsa imhoffii TaxID=382777 RepID=A0A9X0WHT2_9GAMM|nr:glycosyltransferase family 4 protein [Thiocapsa imhoffii]MBK1644858.1 hypothetical protein [Thiocapsa imhoffii]